MPRFRLAPRPARRLGVAFCCALATPILCLGTVPAVADSLGDQIRVSAQGPPGNANFDAEDIDLAYNPSADQYLAVWQGDTATAGEKEVFARLLDGGGAPLGGPFRISTMGPGADTSHGAARPAVTYNGAANEYLVVWEGDDAQNEFEIYGQRISAAGAEVGDDDLRISDMGLDGATAHGAFAPSVAYDTSTNQYMVVWVGRDDADPVVSNEFEIYAQRLDASGAEIGTNDFRISSAGTDGDAARAAASPDIAFNGVDNQFLVVWAADDGAIDNQREVYGQRLDPSGTQIGADDFRISDMGPDVDSAFTVERPTVAHNSATNEYLVVWQGYDDAPAVAVGEAEIYGQRLGGAAADERGTNDFRISDMGVDGSADSGAFAPEVAANPRAREFMVLWRGDDDGAPFLTSDYEIFGQRIDAAGAETGTNDFRVSPVPTGRAPTPDGFRRSPTAYNSQRNEYLNGWEADTFGPPQVDGEFEVFVRRSSAGAPVPPPPTAGVAAAPPPICAAAPTPPTPSAPGRITLSTAQLRINQNIYSAAIKRAKAINDWLDAGIETRDLCAGGLVATAFNSGITIGPGGNGPLDPASVPDPRPITPEPLAGKTGVVFTLSAAQLQINQRIAARGVREANALQARLAAGLSGGDIDDGAVTAGKISTSLVITGAAPAAAPPAKTRTVVAPATPKTGVTFTLSAAQLAINQRIGQAAIRRLNTSRDALLTGIAADELKPATITAVDLAPGVAP